MPANLTPQYNKAEQEYRALTDPAARLEKLREMFRLLPKHKGTEKLQAELKQKISRARDEAEGGKGGGAKGGLSHKVPREGAGQLVLLGGPNVGKSALLAAVTHAHPEVAAYPFTTRAPQPGMMAWEDVPVQLVDLPPITRDFLEPWAMNVIRAADGALLLADLSDDDGPDAADAVRERLEALHTPLVGAYPEGLEDEATIPVRTRVVATKLDAEGARDRLALLEEWLGGAFPIAAISTATGEGLETLRGLAYDQLGVIRVYTKVPGKPVDRSRPFTIPLGGTVEDLAHEIHRDLAAKLKFARIWGSGVYDGQTVRRDHVLHDADVIELHE
jgi:ribosome-interacting GTPase 1